MLSFLKEVNSNSSAIVLLIELNKVRLAYNYLLNAIIINIGKWGHYLEGISTIQKFIDRLKLPLNVRNSTSKLCFLETK